jgi:hypothetical protein
MTISPLSQTVIDESSFAYAPEAQSCRKNCHRRKIFFSYPKFLQHCGAVPRGEQFIPAGVGVAIDDLAGGVGVKPSDGASIARELYSLAGPQ